MENLSLDMENCLPPPVAEVGEASGDELDIASGEGSEICAHQYLATG